MHRILLGVIEKRRFRSFSAINFMRNLIRHPKLTNFLKPLMRKRGKSISAVGLKKPKVFFQIINCVLNFAVAVYYFCIHPFPRWLGNSLALNPIKNLWNKGRVMQNQDHVTLITGLKRIVSKVWKNITLVHQSTLRQIKAVVDAISGHIKY